MMPAAVTVTLVATVHSALMEFDEGVDGKQ
jgi:hypothetical protein